MAHMLNTLSKEQLRAIYDAIIERDNVFVVEMAKCALSDGTDICKDMHGDPSCGLISAVPGDSDIRNQASNLVEDAFGDLHRHVVSSVASLEFTMSIHTKLTGGIHF